MTETVTFGDILVEEQRFIDVIDDVEYACGGVRLHGKGAFIREYKMGAEIRKKFVQHVVRAGDVLFSTLFAKAGAFAVADDDVDGAVLSEKFPTYRLVDDRVSRDYLKWLFRSGQIARIAARQVTGVAAFSLSHLSKRKFLNLRVPAPSLDRQHHVVRICEQTFGRCAALIEPTRTNKRLIGHLVAARTQTLLSGMATAPLGALGGYVQRPANIFPGSSYMQITVGMGHRGLRVRRICDGSEIVSPGQCRVMEHDILFSRIDLWQGAIGVVAKPLQGAVVTRDFPVFRLNETNQLSLEFLRYVFKSSMFMRQAKAVSKGTTGRKKIKRDFFLNFSVPWPSVSEQRQAVDELRRVEAHCAVILGHCVEQATLAKVLPTAVADTLYNQDFD